MERKRNQVHLLQVCFLLWIGILASVFHGTTEQSVTSTMDPTGSPSVANTNGPEDASNTMLPMEHISTDVTMTELMDATMTSQGTNCHHFNCMGEHCYSNETKREDATNATCPIYCALYRHNASYYESKCDEHCIHHLCNDSAQGGCTMNCCNTSGCESTLGNNGTLSNSTAMPSTMVMSTVASTISTTTKTTTIAYSDKKCRSFKCDGADCYKSQTAVQTKPCQVGIIHCELQKIVKNGVISYEAGCSNTCSSSTKSCATITTGDCFQECCNATNAACCMKLDGQVHFNTAPLVRKGSILKIFTCAFFVIFISRFLSSTQASI